MLKSTWIIIGVVGLSFWAPSRSEAKPIDTDAAEIWGIVNGLLVRHEQPGRLSARELNFVLRTSNRDNADCRIAAAYALAFAQHSEVAFEKLRSLAAANSASVSETAGFALLMTDALQMTPADRLARLTTELERAQGGFSRLLLVNWLGCEYGNSMGPTFRDAISAEKDRFVRQEYAYFLIRFGGENNLGAARKMLRHEKGLFYPESLSYMLGTITPGRPLDGMQNTLFLSAAVQDESKSNSRAEEGSNGNGVGAAEALAGEPTPSNSAIAADSPPAAQVPPSSEGGGWAYLVIGLAAVLAISVVGGWLLLRRRQGRRPVSPAADDVGRSE